MLLIIPWCVSPMVNRAIFLECLWVFIAGKVYILGVFNGNDELYNHIYRWDNAFTWSESCMKPTTNAPYPMTRGLFFVSMRQWRKRWIDNIPLEKWTRAFNNGQRWSHMTINLVDLMNFVFKGIWNLSITALVRATYFRLGSLFEIRRSKWSSVLQSCELFSEI